MYKRKLIPCWTCVYNSTSICVQAKWQLIFTLFELTDQECYKYVQNYIKSEGITTLPPTRATADPSKPTLPSKASDVYEENFSITPESFAKHTDNHSRLELIIK